MNARKNLVAAAVAATLIVSPFASIAHAKDPMPAPAETAGASADRAPDASPILRTVDEAERAVREIQQARFALFQGETDAAAKLVSAASDNLGAAQKLLDRHGIERPDAKGATGDAKGAADTWLPLRTSFSLAEGFVPAEQHQKALREADEQMQQGDQKGAVESLRLADVELAISAAMLPANASLEHVQDAKRLIDEKKFFEANLALKAVEDSVVVETWSAAALPVQGATDRGAPDGQSSAPAASQQG